MAFMLDTSSLEDSSPLFLFREKPRPKLTRSSSSSALPTKAKALGFTFADVAEFMFKSLPARTPASTGSSRPLSPSVRKYEVRHFKVNWLETPEAHVFKADLPGVTKEDIKLNPEGESGICISGERKKDVKNEDDIWRCVESFPGAFRRSFELPENANVAEMKATFSDGVLTVTVPKKEDPVKYVEIA